VGVLLKPLLSKLAPIEGYLWAALGVGIFILFYNHHERQIGAAQIKAAVAAEATKHAAEVAKVEADAKIQIDGLKDALVVASAPRANPVHLRVCNNAIQSVAGTGAGSPSQGSNGANGPAGGVAPDATETPEEPGAGASGVDIGPGTEAILARDGAVINYLQGYIKVCQQKGLCKVEK